MDGKITWLSTNRVTGMCVAKNTMKSQRKNSFILADLYWDAIFINENAVNIDIENSFHSRVQAGSGYAVCLYVTRLFRCLSHSVCCLSGPVLIEIDLIVNR